MTTLQALKILKAEFEDLNIPQKDGSLKSLMQLEDVLIQIVKELKEWDTELLEEYITNYYFYVIKGVPMLFKHYENGTDEPRIGGYPENVITSEDEMLEFIKTGFTREDGKHFDFHIEEERRDRIFRHIKDFFKKHPDGIITFG